VNPGFHLALNRSERARQEAGTGRQSRGQQQTCLKEDERAVLRSSIASRLCSCCAMLNVHELGGRYYIGTPKTDISTLHRIVLDLFSETKRLSERASGHVLIGFRSICCCSHGALQARRGRSHDARARKVLDGLRQEGRVCPGRGGRLGALDLP